MTMRTVSVLFAILLSGCATGQLNYAGKMIPGKIVSLSDGMVYPMQIEVTKGSGKMTATNPTTGEYFEGTYTAIRETRQIQYSRQGLLGAEATQKAVEIGDTAPLSAVLVGNKGTVLNIKMQVKAGNPPIGYGDAEDNKGRKFNVQF